MSTGLPPEAMAKLLQLRGLQDEAQIGSSSSQQRLTDLDKTASGRGTSPDDPVYTMEKERLTKQRDKYAARARELANLNGNIEVWLKRMREVSFEVARVPIIKLEDGETLPQAVGRVRLEMATLKSSLFTVEHAPLPKAQLIERARQKIDALAERGRPALNFDSKTGEFDFAFRHEPGTGGPSPDHALHALAWFDRDRLLERITAEINMRPEPKMVLSVEERRARTREINERVDMLERLEEALIMRAQSDGLEILRRPNANPAAVLGIAVKRRSANAA